MNFEYNENSNEISIFVPKSLYTKEVLLKCFYWYLHEFSVDIDYEKDEVVVVKMRNKMKEILKEQELSSLKDKMHQDLIDYSLRQIVTDETKNVRDILVAKAFQNFE